ncbi:MAG: hypothetical protein CM15mP46_4430 [Alphaproteobacteria bacterium]|nr:MAG: hypothetical protein CM15mP46_4430 [Alphaproteobacteria bacterium]
MAIEIIVPTLGESVSDATVARWIKTTGIMWRLMNQLSSLKPTRSLEVPARRQARLVILWRLRVLLLRWGRSRPARRRRWRGAGQASKNAAETPAENLLKNLGACYRSRCFGSSSTSRRGEPRSLVASRAPPCDRT